MGIHIDSRVSEPEFHIHVQFLRCDLLKCFWFQFVNCVFAMYMS